jgi:Skp family chaperone for outer membrane proteins
MALKRLDSISTIGKEHLEALQAQVERHDEKIQALQNLLLKKEKKREQKLERIEGVETLFRQLSVVRKSMSNSSSIEEKHIMMEAPESLR